MKKRLILLVLAFTVAAAMIMTACGGNKSRTLEMYAADHPEIQEKIDEAVKDSDVVIEIKDNDIIYSFDLSKMEGYTEELAKSEEIKSALEKALGDAGNLFGNISKQIEESTEITGINTVVNYTWGDEVLVTKTFTAADADAAADTAE